MTSLAKCLLPHLQEENFRKQEQAFIVTCGHSGEKERVGQIEISTHTYTTVKELSSGNLLDNIQAAQTGTRDDLEE